MNAYIYHLSAEIIEIVKHTDIEWTFRVETSTKRCTSRKIL